MMNLRPGYDDQQQPHQPHQQQPHQPQQQQPHQQQQQQIRTANGHIPNATTRKKEIYKFEANRHIYASSWSTKPNSTFRLAIASFIEEYNNHIQLVQLEENASDLSASFQFNHPYPPTKISFIPDPNNCHPELLATSADFLRIWLIPNSILDSNQNDITGFMEQQQQQQSVSLRCLLNSNKDASYCAPITSFDWNDIDPNILATSSIDTTCTIWDLELGKISQQISSSISNANNPPSNSLGRVETQLIAHDREVYDVAFSRCGSGRDSFATAGGDGLVRMFDLRNLKHFITLYDNQQDQTGNFSRAMVRLACNKENPNYIATLALDTKEVIILDIRKPRMPAACLLNHSANVNGLAWAPHSACHLSTASDDRQALIWDLINLPNPIKDPILAYQAQDKVNRIDWSAAHPDWISICHGNTLEILRV